MKAGTSEWIVRLYERAIGACRTENERNSVHIALGNRITPGELKQLATHAGVSSALYGSTSSEKRSLRSGVGIRLRRLAFTHVDLENPFIHRSRQVLKPIVGAREVSHTQHWLSNQTALCEMAGNEDIQPFMRAKRAPGVLLYTDGESRSVKTLTIVFSPKSQRPGMPVSTFLQLFNAATTDVALVANNRSRGFQDGISGLSGDFTSSCLKLQDMLEASEYARTTTMGVSAGGLPSIVGAYLIAADACLAAGAVFSNDTLLGLLASLATTGSREPAVTLLFSGEHVRDRESAHRFAEVCGNSRLMELPGREHNCLYELLKAGRLARVIEESLGT